MSGALVKARHRLQQKVSTDITSGILDGPSALLYAVSQAAVYKHETALAHKDILRVSEERRFYRGTSTYARKSRSVIGSYKEKVKGIRRKEASQARWFARERERFADDDATRKLREKKEQKLEFQLEREAFEAKERARLADLASAHGLGWVSSNLRQCGQRVTFECPDHPGIRTTEYWYCQTRGCPTCERLRSRRSHAVLYPLVRRMPNPMHIVLTQQKRVGETLEQSLARLNRSWKRFYRAKGFPAKVWFRGGVRSTEVTGSLATGYHVHFHLLVDFPHRRYPDGWLDLLREAWVRAGGGPILRVDFCRVYGPVEKSLSEAVKYLTKAGGHKNDGAEEKGLDNEAYLELWTSLKGRRFITTFGTLYNQRANLTPPIVAPHRCELCGKRLKPVEYQKYETQERGP